MGTRSVTVVTNDWVVTVPMSVSGRVVVDDKVWVTVLWGGY